MTKYWHVTAVENYTSILRSGLRLNGEGKIYLFTDKRLAGKIAVDQLFLKDYALFQICSLDESRLSADNVGELTACLHKIYDLAIPTSDLKFHGLFKVRINNAKI